MKTRRPRRPGPIAGVLALLCCSFLPVFATSDAAVGARTPSEEREGMDEALDTLLRGDPAARRAAAEGAGSSFGFLVALDCGDGDSREVLKALERIVRTETDDWISSRLLQNLLALDTDCLNPLYRLALKSRSENLRWRAIQWFGEHEDEEAVPLLEDLWRFEERPWARADLMAALVENGVAGYLDEFLEIAGEEDATLSRAAFGAIRSLGDARAVPGLARLSREGEATVRSEAVSALASFPESPEALLAVLDATGADDPDLQEMAVAVLGNFPERRATERALDFARAGNRAEVRSAAISVLRKLKPPETLPVLSDLLHEPATREIAGLQNEAIWVLQEMDDPAAIPMLRDLDPKLGGAGFDNVGGLLKSLSRSRPAGARKSAWFRSSCGGPRSPRDSDGPRFLTVTPPGEWRSIRCWQFPGVAGDPGAFPRIHEGSRVWIRDHFEGEDGSWVSIRPPGAGEDCWVPRPFLDAPARGGWFSSLRALRGSQDFDLPEDVPWREPARSLVNAGLLQLFDPGDGVVGAFLTLEPGDSAAVALLIRSCQESNGIFQEQIGDLLGALHRSCSTRGEEMTSPGDEGSPGTEEEDLETTEEENPDIWSDDPEADWDSVPVPEP